MSCILFLQSARHGPVNKFANKTPGWEADFEVPDVSVKTAQALESGKVSLSTRTELIGAVAYSVWGYTHYPTGEQYNTICAKVVSKYPVLKDTIGTPYVSQTSLVKPLLLIPLLYNV